MIETMGMQGLPPRTKTFLRLMTAGFAVLVLAMGANMWLMVGKAKRSQAPLSAVVPGPAVDRTLDALGAIPFSAPSSSHRPVNGPDGVEGGRKPPPPLDTTGLELKGVFVNIFDKRKSIAIIGSKGNRDIIMKDGDSAKEGVMLEEIFPDHVVFRGIAGDTQSMALANFVKNTVIFGGNTPMTESLSDIENPMGVPMFDPLVPDPSMAGDVTGDGGADPGPVRYMPTPQMPTAANGGAPMAAPMVGGSETARTISGEMNAVGRTPREGQ
jgi:hypothetical protein